MSSSAKTTNRSTGSIYLSLFSIFFPAFFFILVDVNKVLKEIHNKWQNVIKEEPPNVIFLEGENPLLGDTKMTENLAVDRIYCGDMTDLQPPLRPVIRIYLSSSFTDMVMEKTELVNHIFPIIRNYCKDRHGVDFQVWFYIITTP